MSEMCWKYENAYASCFDYFTEDLIEDIRSLPGLLKETYGVDVVASSKFRDLIEEMLSKAHESGVIRPKKEGAE